MAKSTNHYVEFYFPPTDPSDSLVFRGTERIEKREVKSLKTPPDVVAFRFFDLIIRGRRLNVSPIHFINGQILQAKKALEVIPDGKLRNRIVSEKWERVVLCNDGEFRQFKHSDIVVAPKKKELKEA